MLVFVDKDVAAVVVEATGVMLVSVVAVVVLDWLSVVMVVVIVVVVLFDGDGFG